MYPTSTIKYTLNPYQVANYTKKDHDNGDATTAAFFILCLLFFLWLSSFGGHLAQQRFSTTLGSWGEWPLKLPHLSPVVL